MTGLHLVFVSSYVRVRESVENTKEEKDSRSRTIKETNLSGNRQTKTYDVMVSSPPSITSEKGKMDQ